MSEIITKIDENMSAPKVEKVDLKTIKTEKMKDELIDYVNHLKNDKSFLKMCEEYAKKHNNKNH